MPAIGLLAIGGDPAWRARMQRIFSLRSDVRWLGAHAPGSLRPPREATPDLLLLDGDDPRVERRRRRNGTTAPHRLYFFAHVDAFGLRHCLRSAASGCLDKDASVDAVCRAVRAADAGLFVMTPNLLRVLADVPVPSPVAGDEVAATAENTICANSELTQRQREIVACVSQGMSNKQIARALGISPETVKSHLRNMFEREGVHGRMALLVGGKH